MAQSSDDPVCSICKAEVKLLDKTGNATGYDCGEHGRFRVVDTIFGTADIDAPRARKAGPSYTASEFNS